MTDIITPAVAAQKQILTRAPQLYVTNPYNGDPEISFTSEGLLLLDGQPVAHLPAPAVIRKMSAVAAQMVTITDPVTGHPVTASCAGIFAAVAQLYVDWFNQDNPAQ